MRSIDKRKNMEKANLMLEKSYLEYRGMLVFNVKEQIEDMKKYLEKNKDAKCTEAFNKLSKNHDNYEDWCKIFSKIKNELKSKPKNPKI